VKAVKYVVVCSDGTSYDLGPQKPIMEWGKPKPPRFDLPELLADGWIPVRETGMGGGDHIAFALVLLEK
jgi:hypothetical protein